MKKINIILLFFLGVSLGLHAQKTAVKLGVGGLFVTSPNLRFETALSDRMSFQLTGSYKIPTNVNFQDFNNSNEVVWTDGKLRGFAIIPELRFYFGAANAGTIEGFYLAPFLKYHRYGVNSSANFDYTSLEGQTYNLNPDMKINLGTIGGGLQIGYHWIFGEHFSLDWHFLGFSIDRHRIVGRADFSNSDVDLKDVTKFLIDEYNQTYPDAPIDVTDEQIDEFPIEGNNIKFSLPFFFPGFRAGISIGYAF